MEGFYIDSYKRVWGNKTINGEKAITDSNNVLTIEANDSTYDITLSPGSYKTEFTANDSELVDEIKNKVTLSGFPIEVLLGGYHKDEKYNVVVVRMTNGKDIINISGTFFDEYF
ncbi:hypothetical protein [Paenibacillus sp. TH7-28]